MGISTEPIAIDRERVQSLITREEERFRAGRRRSDELWREARKVSPRGVPSSHQDAPPQPVFVERGLTLRASLQSSAERPRVARKRFSSRAIRA